MSIDEKDLVFDRLLTAARGFALDDIEARTATDQLMEPPHDDPFDAVALSGYVDSLYELMQAEIDARIERGLPPPPAMCPPATARIRWPWIAAASLALPLLGWGLLSAVSMTERETLKPYEATDQLRRDGSLPLRSGARAPSHSAGRPWSQAESDPGQAEDVDPPAQTQAGSDEMPNPNQNSDPSPTGTPSSRPDAATVRPLGERLAALDAVARQRWQQGDLAGAERAFRRIVRLGGRRVEAERAYAELFSLVRQTQGAAARNEVWNAYLKRFPHGRYADDVRAGLCGGTQGDGSAACWGAYLQSFPMGSHRVQATRALGRLAEEAKQ